MLKSLVPILFEKQLQDGPLSYVCWFINHEIIPMNIIVILSTINCQCHDPPDSISRGDEDFGVNYRGTTGVQQGYRVLTCFDPYPYHCIFSRLT